MNTKKILFVDDEPAVLDGYRRVLHKDFDVDTANSGLEALAAIKEGTPYAVIVSDMRMPGMDGVQLLSRVRELVPNTVRVVLTGYADIQSAMNAVNEGNVFRFLTKPCESPTLKKALASCIAQHQLILAEKELLEHTLMGSIKVMTDVLSLANPAAFGRALRLRRYVQHIATKLGLESPWKLEAAAMLSQLGCITLETELIEAAYCGKTLKPEEQERFDQHPKVAFDLLSNIPRLEGIAWIVGHQRNELDVSGDPTQEGIQFGAEILRAAIAYDDYKIRGLSDADAASELRRNRRTNPRIMEALDTFTSVGGEAETKSMRIPDLTTGMILQEEVKNKAGLLLVGKGQEITYPLLVRLKNFHQRRAIADRVMVLVPRTEATEAAEVATVAG